VAGSRTACPARRIAHPGPARGGPLRCPLPQGPPISSWDSTAVDRSSRSRSYLGGSSLSPGSGPSCRDPNTSPTCARRLRRGLCAQGSWGAARAAASRRSSSSRSCVTATAACASWPTWRCRRRSPLRSCAESTGGEDRPSPDRSGPQCDGSPGRDTCRDRAVTRRQPAPAGGWRASGSDVRLHVHGTLGRAVQDKADQPSQRRLVPSRPGARGAARSRASVFR
jgi:hypothetical protein